MLRYRLSSTSDPEERLEDAAMWKAIHDVFGDEAALYVDPPKQVETSEPRRVPKIAEIMDAIAADGDDEMSDLMRRRAAEMRERPLDPVHVLAEDDILLGRPRNDDFQWPTDRLAAAHLEYWKDPAFLSAAGRSFELHGLNEAIAAVKALHAQGKGAFLKSTRTKHWIGRVPVGSEAMDVIDSMAYEFADVPDCLMVQELVPMEYEMRFVVMDRQIVAGASVAHWMTPLDHELATQRLARTPSSRELEWNPGLIERLRQFAQQVAQDLAAPDCILDVCWSNGRPIAIELNAMVIGHFGLYGMNVHDIARGVKDILLPRHEAKKAAPPSP